MGIVLGLLRLLVGLLIVVTAVPAILALSGFVVRFFDIFNHLQLLLFFGTLVAAILALFLMPMGWKVFAVVGLVASGIIFVPEWVSGFAPRPAAPAGATVLKRE